MERYRYSNDGLEAVNDPENRQLWSDLQSKIDKCRGMADNVSTAVVQIDSCYDLIIQPHSPIRYEEFVAHTADESAMETIFEPFRLIGGAEVPIKKDGELVRPQILGSFNHADAKSARLFYFDPAEHTVAAEKLRENNIASKGGIGLLIESGVEIFTVY